MVQLPNATKQHHLSARAAIAIFGVTGQHQLQVVQPIQHQQTIHIIRQTDVAVTMVGQQVQQIGVHTSTIHQHLTRIAVLKPATEQALLSARIKLTVIFGTYSPLQR